MTTLQAYTAGGLNSLLGKTGYTGLSVAIGSPATKVVITATSAEALLADGTLITPATITLNVSTTTGIYYLWLDRSTDGLNTPVWTTTVIATAAPSANAIAVGLAKVTGAVVTHVALFPAGFFGDAKEMKVASGTIARTDTVEKDLFALPAGAVIHQVFCNVGVASDAGTTSAISIGSFAVTDGDDTFKQDYSVLVGNLGYATVTPVVTAIGPQAAAIGVVGLIEETGTASTTGGPFTVYMFYV